MKIRSDGTVELERGEPIPVHCRCGEIYQPTVDSELSDCPRCGRVNVHGVCPDVEMVGRIQPEEQQ